MIDGFKEAINLLDHFIFIEKELHNVHDIQTQYMMESPQRGRG